MLRMPSVSISEVIFNLHFFKEKRGKSYAPFSRDLRQGEVDTIFMHAMHQTDRYRAMKKAGASEKEIKAAFNEPVEMRVFSWEVL